MTTKPQAAQGTQTPQAGATEFNALNFQIRQILALVNVGTPVEVIAVTNSGGVSPVGFVDAHPLVNQLDGFKNAVPHGVIYRIPYIRIQGGSNAIILDPEVGDIGFMVVADKDISKVKATKAESNPGSARRFDLADGIYIGGILNGTPDQYVQFTASGINITSPGTLTLTAASIVLDGPVNATGTVEAATSITAPTVEGTTDVIFNGISGSNHKHDGGTVGIGETGGPV